MKQMKPRQYECTFLSVSAMKHTTLLFLLLFVVKWSYSYNILVMFPYPGISHFLSFVELFKMLARKGHNVTIVSHFPQEKQIPNYRDINIGGYEVFLKTGFFQMPDLSQMDSKSRFNKYFISVLLAEVADTMCNVAFSSKTVQDFLKEDNHFDVAISEYFNSDCILTVAKKLKVPVVRIHSCTLMPWTSKRYAIPDHPAYIPNNFLPFSDRMSFFERIENTIISVIHSVYFNKFVLDNDKRVSMKYFGELAATLESDVLNDSLLLVASHFSLNLPRPMVPNVIEVGGIHVGKPNALSKVRFIR